MIPIDMDYVPPIPWLWALSASCPRLIPIDMDCVPSRGVTSVQRRGDEIKIDKDMYHGGEGRIDKNVYHGGEEGLIKSKVISE